MIKLNKTIFSFCLNVYSSIEYFTHLFIEIFQSCLLQICNMWGKVKHFFMSKYIIQAYRSYIHFYLLSIFKFGLQSMTLNRIYLSLMLVFIPITSLIKPFPATDKSQIL